MTTPDELPFEHAITKLEAILEKMNSGAVPLDDALHLYEEADKLANSCQKRLQDAEKRIEILMKNRQGEVALGPDGKPLTQPFTSNK